MEQLEPFEEKDWLKPQLLSLMSHELRSPLQTINGYLDLLLCGLGGRLNEQQADFARRARISGEHMAALVDDLILFVRYTAGQLTFAKYDTNLTQLIHESLEEMRLLAARAKVQLRTRVPRTLPPISADRARIAQLICDLVDNALMFTPEGGEVLVSARYLPMVTTRALDARQRASSSRPSTQGTIVLKVRDSGVGIPAENLARVFTPFFRATADRIIPGHDRGHGVGLGLTCVRIIAEGHGGTMRVQSSSQNTAQHGTTFSVFLPLKINGAETSIPA